MTSTIEIHPTRIGQQADRAKAASDEFPALNPKTAIVYFDLVFEDFNLEEDQSPDADADGRERAEAFLALHKGDLDKAMMMAESAAMADMAARLKKAGLPGRLANEGHSSDGSLAMKFGVDSVDDVKKLVKFVQRSSGGGEDEIYLDAPYMAARGFHFYPDGVNNTRFGFGGGISGQGDIEEWLETQG